MSWDKIGSSFLKPSLKFAGSVVIPITTATIIWKTMENVVTVLAVILLLILIAKNCGVPTTKLYGRIERSWIGKVIKFIGRFSFAAKMNEEYFEDAAEMGAEIIKPVIEQTIKINNKIKEEITMSKLNAWKERSVIWLKYNKKDILGNLALILLAIDRYFGISVKYGLPPDVANWIAGIIFVIVLAVMGGEGWTSNLINRVRESEAIAEAEANKKTKEYKRKLADVNKEANLILKKYGIEGILPEAMKPDYAKLMEAKREYEEKIQEILSEIKNRTAQ